MSVFRFKQFSIKHDRCAMKVGTDGVLLGAWAEGGQRILDIGTGTGLIALMMAQRFQYADVTGIEIDAAAAVQAAENVAESPFASRVSIKHQGLQEADFAEPFDAITCNPPYYDNSLLCPDSVRSQARHTTTLTYRDLIEHSKRLLTARGALSLVLPADSLSRIEEECAFAAMFIHRRVYLRTTERKPPKRILLEIRKTVPQEPQAHTEVLMCEGERSPWYTALTQDFYVS